MKQLVDLSACIYIEIERKKKEKRKKWIRSRIARLIVWQKY